MLRRSRTAEAEHGVLLPVQTLHAPAPRRSAVASGTAEPSRQAHAQALRHCLQGVLRRREAGAFAQHGAAEIPWKGPSSVGDVPCGIVQPSRASGCGFKAWAGCESAAQIVCAARSSRCISDPTTAAAGAPCAASCATWKNCRGQRQGRRRGRQRGPVRHVGAHLRSAEARQAGSPRQALPAHGGAAQEGIEPPQGRSAAPSQDEAQAVAAAAQLAAPPIPRIG